MSPKTKELKEAIISGRIDKLKPDTITDINIKNKLSDFYMGKDNGKNKSNEKLWKTREQ